MSKTKVAASIVILVIGAVAACSSSSSNGNGDPGGGGCPGGGRTGPHTGNSTCDTCSQSKCGSQISSCYSGGGGCGAFVSCASSCACNDVACYTSCQAKIDSKCLACSQTFESCQKSSCATECKPPGAADAGTDAAAGANCAALAVCCADPSLPDGGADGCAAVAKSADDATCKAELDALKSAGYCK